MDASKNTTAIDELVHAFFGAIDNRNGRVPTSTEIAALFIGKTGDRPRFPIGWRT